MLEEKLRPCDICGSDDYTVINQREAWTSARKIEQGRHVFHETDVICNKCGVIFKNPMITQKSQLEFYKEDYTKLYEPDNIKMIGGHSIVYRMLNVLHILDWLEEIEYDLDGKNVVDIGSGFGTLLYACARLGSNIIGIEPGIRPAEISFKLFGLTPVGRTLDSITYLDLKTLDLRDKDLVIISNTLEHFYSPVEALSKATGMLKPEGKLLVEVPSAFHPYPMINTDGFFSSAHNYTFDKDSFRCLAARCGLAVEAFSFAGHKKSMFFLLKKEAGTEVISDPHDVAVRITKLKWLYQEYNKFFTEVVLKLKTCRLFDSLEDVKILLQDYPHFTNIIMINYMEALLNGHNYKGAIDFSKTELGQYDDSQSGDIYYSMGTYFGVIGLAYKNIGDFKLAKEYYKAALDAYPHVGKHNIIRDLYIDGILPEGIFNQYMFRFCERELISMG